MTDRDDIQYTRIAKAIAYIQQHFKEQPTLEEVAAQVHLSSFHFQKLFTEWAGVSPKKFLQYISVEYAKQLLKERQSTLSGAAEQTGLSGTGRLHDLFVKVEGMTPGEFKNGGESLSIRYSFAKTPFGNTIVASTGKGICYLVFQEDEAAALAALREQFPNAQFSREEDPLHQQALAAFDFSANPVPVRLHLKGTGFQLKVWEALLSIPMGQLSTYGSMAETIGNPKASRAVGTAIGSNPVAFLIPCHRVIQSSGIIGGYMWGPIRKTAIIGWEAARLSQGSGKERNSD